MAACMTSNSVDVKPLSDEDSLEFVLAVVGKSGTGKSSLCQQIASVESEIAENAKHEFEIGHGLSTVTTETGKMTVKRRSGRSFKVMDIPDGKKEFRHEAKTLKKRRKKSPIFFLYCVRCDARYAAEEHRVYVKLKKYWKNEEDLHSRLMVVYTHGESLSDYYHSEKPDAELTRTAELGKPLDQRTRPEGKDRLKEKRRDFGATPTTCNESPDPQDVRLQRLHEMMNGLNWPQLNELKNNAIQEEFIFCNKEIVVGNRDATNLIAYISSFKSKPKEKKQTKTKSS